MVKGRANLLGGIGGIAFGVLTVVALFVASPAGGTYAASDVQSFVASNHHAAVFVALYLTTLGVLGLLLLLSRLREMFNEAGTADSGLSTAFWSAGLAAAVCLAAGWAVAFSVPISYAFAGSSAFTLTSPQTYALIELGDILVYGPGGIFLGCALLALFAGARNVLPTWLRWVTLVAGVLALASPAFFPWFALLLWGVASGIWLLASNRAST